MFAVIFEVQPKSDRWDQYLGLAKQLRPELERIDGFIENVRYSSRRTEGRLLSLSIWADEKAVIRWRTHAMHHGVQEKGRLRYSRITICGSVKSLPTRRPLPAERWMSSGLTPRMLARQRSSRFWRAVRRRFPRPDR